MTDLKPLRYPDFICIGAQKGGTTWLDRMLRQHPDVWLPPTKEVHYFNRVFEQAADDSVKNIRKIDRSRIESVLKSVRRTLDAPDPPTRKMAKIYCLSLIGAARPTDETYGRIFQTAPESAVCGEITPNYARLPEEGIQHMFRLQPRLKLIFMLRDPIDRDWSHLKMQDQRKELQKVPHAERLSHPALLGYSDYATTIERFRRHVPAEDFLILFFDDMIEQPQNVLRQTCAFLGLDYELAKFSQAEEPVNAGKPDLIPPELYVALREALSPVYQRLLSSNIPVVQKWYDKHYGAPESPSEVLPVAGHD